MLPRRRLPLALTAANGLLLAALAFGASLYARSSPPPSAPPPDLPACAAGTRIALRAGYDQWADTLLDPTFQLPNGYEPPDLRTEPIEGEQVRLRAFVFAPLRQMLTAAAQAGITITVTSSYRGYAQQVQLERGLGRIDDLVARAGHSEHQLGTALDLHGGWDWLGRNAWRYGFVVSYPPSRSPASTCYRPEPWHVRYFGVDRARAITESGLSSREWLWALSLSGGDHRSTPD